MTIALTTLARFKAFYGSTKSADDVAVSALIDRVSVAIERDLGRTIQATGLDVTEVDWLPQWARTVLLRAFPVTEVSSVKYARTALDWSAVDALTVGTHYWLDLDRGVVHLDVNTKYDPTWYQVIYKGGLAASTAALIADTSLCDLEQAAMMQVAYYWERRDKPGGSKTMEGGSVSFDGAIKLLEGVRELISPFKRDVGGLY